MLFSCNFGTWWWPFFVWNVLNCTKKGYCQITEVLNKMIFTEFAYFLVNGSFKTMLYIGIVYIIVYWNKPSLGILNRYLCINNRWLFIVLMSVWQYNWIFLNEPFFQLFFHKCVHYVYIEHQTLLFQKSNENMKWNVSKSPLNQLNRTERCLHV